MSFKTILWVILALVVVGLIGTLVYRIMRRRNGADGVNPFTLVRVVLWIVVLAVVGAGLHYTLPKREVVYITEAANRQMVISPNSPFWDSPGVGRVLENGDVQRDVLFINAKRADGSDAVFRNEDTGIWPPYFKFDSANLHSEALDLRSTREAPKWVVVRYYGWRILWPVTAFPNAVSVKEVAGPDVTLIPWFNIIFLSVLVAVFWAVRVRWNRFWENRRLARENAV